MLQTTRSPLAIFCRHGHPLAATSLSTLGWLYGRWDNRFTSVGPSPSTSTAPLPTRRIQDSSLSVLLAPLTLNVLHSWLKLPTRLRSHTSAPQSLFQLQ